MANFLNRLAARALGVASLAEPVIPTRFSADAASRGSLGFGPFAEGNIGEGTSVASFDSRPAPRRTGEVDAGMRTHAVAAAPVFADIDFPVRATREEIRPHTTQHGDTSLPSRSAEPVSAQPSMQHSVAGMRDSTAAENHAIARDVASPLDLSFVPEAAQALPSAAPPPFAEPRRASHPVPAVPAPHSAAIQQQQVMQAPRPAPVRISIGRIDVRAEIASSPAPAQRPRPAALSLDQFLARAGRTR